MKPRLGLLALAAWLPAQLALGSSADFFGIEVLDEQTNRGIPMVEFETVNHVRFCTDSLGLVALNDPDLLRQTVYFHVNAPGYEVPADAAGFRGVAIATDPGLTATIKLKRLNIAERVYRLTGSGIYRDSVLLEHKPPIEEPLLNGQVAGQDSMVATLFRGHVFWFGGDTLRLRNPRGQYRTSGAISDPPGVFGLDPNKGVNLRYLVDGDGFPRAMWPKITEGAVWTDGLMVLNDTDGVERLLAHYAQMKSATEMIAHGIGVFDHTKNQFSVATEFPKAAAWRHPSGHPVAGTGADEGYFLFPAPEAGLSPFPAVRVRATMDDVQRPGAYECFTYLAPGSEKVERGEDGSPVYGWKSKAHPVSQKQERELIAAGALTEAEALYQVHDVDTGTLLEFHAGSVAWNAWRKKWIMIAEQLGTTSFSGEIWYAEADGPAGPWRTARRIATHGRQSFYNPVHHPFFDQLEGRIIYFEGSYANTGGGGGVTPRYEFNQLMYRLDLAEPRLKLVP